MTKHYSNGIIILFQNSLKLVVNIYWFIHSVHYTQVYIYIYRYRYIKRQTHTHTQRQRETERQRFYLQESHLNSSHSNFQTREQMMAENSTCSGVEKCPNSLHPDRWFYAVLTMGNRFGNSGNSGRLYFGGLQNHCRWWLQPWN